MRAHDDYGDYGVCVGSYRWHWMAQRRLRRANTELVFLRANRGWVEVWSYYILEVP